MKDGIYGDIIENLLMLLTKNIYLDTKNGRKPKSSIFEIKDFMKSTIMARQPAGRNCLSKKGHHDNQGNIETIETQLRYEILQVNGEPLWITLKNKCGQGTVRIQTIHHFQVFRNLVTKENQS